MAEAKPNFEFVKTFNPNDLSAFLKQESVSIKTTTRGKSGTIKHYSCRNFRRYQCKYRVRCEFSSLSEAVDVYAAGAHDHSNDGSERFFHPEIIQIAEWGVQRDRTPKQIGDDIEKSGHEKPDPIQLANLAQRCRRKVKYTGPTTQFELLEFCQKRQLTGNTGPHDVIMPIYDINQSRLHLTFTTRHLMETAALSPLFQVDATFKLNWHNYPCIITGSQDKDRRFHPSMFHIVWKEEDTDVYGSVFKSYLDTLHQFGIPVVAPSYVLGDGHGGITAAAPLHFPGSQRFMCWYHAKAAVKKCDSLKGYPESEKEKIYTLVDDLQLAPTPSIFRAAAELFILKVESMGYSAFSRYFRSTYIDGPLCNWYEGALRCFPAHNNGVEGTNSSVKSTTTQRVRETMAVFLPRIENMVGNWSTASLKAGFKTTPSIAMPVWDAAWKWSQSDPATQSIVQLPYPNYPVYGVKGSGQTMDFEQYMNLFNDPGQFTDFSQYQQWLHEWHLVEGFPGYLTCTCRKGLKEYRCKHSVGIEILHHGLQVPPEVNSLPISVFRKRGRPKKVGPALSRE